MNKILQGKNIYSYITLLEIFHPTSRCTLNIAQRLVFRRNQENHEEMGSTSYRQDRQKYKNVVNKISHGTEESG